MKRSFSTVCCGGKTPPESDHSEEIIHNKLVATAQDTLTHQQQQLSPPYQPNNEKRVKRQRRSSIARAENSCSKKKVRFATTISILEFTCTTEEERSEMWYTSEKHLEFRIKVAKLLSAMGRQEENQQQRRHCFDQDEDFRGLEPWIHSKFRQQKREKLLDSVFQEQHAQQNLVLAAAQKLPYSQVLTQLCHFRIKQASQRISSHDPLDAFQRGQVDAMVARQIFWEEIYRGVGHTTCSTEQQELDTFGSSNGAPREYDNSSSSNSLDVSTLSPPTAPLERT